MKKTGKSFDVFDLYMQQRRAAVTSHEQEITLDEINAEIRAARKERREKQSCV